MYVGTDIGVYRSIDAGATWTPFSNGLPRIAIFDIAFQEQNGVNQTERVLRIATHGRGIWEIAVPALPQVASVVSRKTHSAAGPFDIDLPLGGTPGVECRVGQGANRDKHQVIVTFAVAASFSGVVVTPESGETAQLDGAPMSNAGNTQLTINLTNVSDDQTLTITLQDVVTAGSTPANVVIPMTLLAGDTTADGRVNVTDTTQTKSNAGSLTNAGNFRTDVNVDGRINVTDTSFVKARAGA